jgi:hypothetical protein
VNNQLSLPSLPQCVDQLRKQNQEGLCEHTRAEQQVRIARQAGMSECRADRHLFLMIQ